MAISLKISWNLFNCRDALEAEPSTCMEGLSIAIHRSDLPITIEMDSLAVVALIESHEVDRLVYATIINEIKHLRASIPPMRFTDDECDLAAPLETLQAPYLPLTGPSRAIVLSVHHSYIEVELKLKRDSGDEEFSYVSDAYIEIVPFNSFVMQRDLTSRLSTLQLTVAHIVHSVEATISVKVNHGEWPYDHGGLFTASTASINDMEVVLLGFEVDEVLPVKDDGYVKLFRRVVSVESKGKLEVSVEANPANDEEDVIRDDVYFTPKRSGRSHQMLKVGSCEMECSRGTACEVLIPVYVMLNLLK
ncbi:hypothetical protein VPH35_079261 [Triticum aestivum]|uniref:Uncharacterized protein n=1 Tax=Aegilops tauschii TaxID=37682 RepID=M8B3R2_AEGTA